MTPAAQILRKTGEMLETRSLEQLRVADILSEAGVSRAAFYGAYSNKVEVVAALVREGIDEALPVAERYLGGEAPRDAGALAEIFEGWLGILVEHRSWLLAAMDGRMRHPELAELQRESFQRLVVQLDMGDPALSAAMLAAAESALYGFLSESRDMADARAVAESLAAMYLGALN